MPVMHRTSKDLLRLRPLLELADDGTITLPEEVNATRAAYARLVEAAAAADLETRDIASHLNDALVAGAPIPTVDEVAAEMTHKAAAQLIHNVLAEAVTRLDELVVSSVTGHAEEMIAESLRPAFDATMADARKAVAELGDYTGDPRELLVAPEKQRKARAALDGITTRYLVLRGAQAILSQWDPPQTDTTGRYRDMRNLEQFIPLGAQHQNHTPPWPTEPVDRLIWLIHHDADLWMPTAAERDAAFTEANPGAPVVTGRTPDWAAVRPQHATVPF